MRYWALALILSGFLLPWACAPSFPTTSNTGGHDRFYTPTFTPTNLNGWTSTPTPTFQPTPAFVGTFNTSAPNGLAYANNFIYVAEGFDNGGQAVSQVQVFNASSTSTASWTWTTYDGTHSFQYPNGIAINSTSSPMSVYVLDAGNSDNNGAIYVMAATATPTLYTSWASYNGTTLSGPGGIALDTNGNVYVADTYNEKLEEFSPTGSAIASWSAQNVYPVGVAVDSNNHVYVADGDYDELYALSSSGSSFSVTTQWKLPSVSSSEDDGNLDYYGLGVDSSNNIYVADYYNSQVEVYTSTGGQLGVFTGNESGATQLTGPDAVLVTNNDIYIGDYDSKTYDGTNLAGLIEIFGPDTY